MWSHWYFLSLREKCEYSEFFWSIFSRIRIEYGEIHRISLSLSVSLSLCLSLSVSLSLCVRASLWLDAYKTTHKQTNLHTYIRTYITKENIATHHKNTYISTYIHTSRQAGKQTDGQTDIRFNNATSWNHTSYAAVSIMPLSTTCWLRIQIQPCTHGRRRPPP